MARRKKNVPEEPQAETRKQTRMRLRDQERNRRLSMIVGGAILVALLLVVAGVVSEMVIKPRSVLARVEGRPIVTRDFWERTLLQKSELENQLVQLQLFSQQFGDQNFFASQIAQIQSTLSSPLSLGTQVINQMIDEQVIRLKAEELGVTVSDEEVDEALREEVAAGQGAVTVPQATATAEAGVAATATAELFTPTPEPTPEPATVPITDTEALTETAPLATAESPTPEPPTLLTDELYEEGLQTLADNLREQAGLSLEEYREIIRTRLLTEKLQEVIGEEQVAATEEQIQVRHILISIDETEPITPTEGITTTEGISAVDGITLTEEITATGEITATDGITGTETLPADTTVDDAEALALATELRARILAGEDFAELAREYSDDPGSGAEGGDLGWVGRGQFVPEFEEVAFTLPVGEISEPVRTDFGYHLIEVVDRDEARPKEENQLAQERAQAFDAWLQEQVLALNIERPENLPSRLPAGL